MKRADEISAEEVMNENHFTVSSDMSLAQVKDRMEDQELRAVPVVSEKNKLEGAIGYRDLIRQIQFNPEHTKLSKVMHQPPHFDRDDNLVDLCDLRINSGRKMLVLTEGNKLKGVVGDPEFLRAFKDTEEIQDLKTDYIASKELFTAYESDSIEKARHMILDNNISRLPIIDNDGKITGMVHSTDLLRTMIQKQRTDRGGTGGGRTQASKGKSSGEELYASGSVEKEKMSDINVTEIMDRTFSMSEEYLSGAEAVDQMLQDETDEIIFVDGKYPEAIVTVKDFINLIEDLKPSNTVLVNLVGVEVPEEKEALHEKIRNQLTGSLGRKLERPEELTVHVKKADKDGKKHRYEFNVKLHSEFGVTHVEEEGWEMLDVIDSALDELNTQIRKKKEKREEKRRQ